jgi:Flp pilus assembly pilin Flp
MTRWVRIIKRLITAQEGASLVEYALGLLLIVVVTLAAIRILGTTLSGFFVSAAGSI